MEILDRSLVRVDDRGFEVWPELCALPDFDVSVLSNGADPDDTHDVVAALKEAGGSVVENLSCFTPAGHRIGTEREAAMLYARGIAPEKRSSDHEMCSIGFAKDQQKWYGWSHRAIWGFRVGDVVSEGDCTAASGWTDEYLAEHPEADLSLPVGFTARTLDDARRMAVAFADSVS